jgi:ABC-type uncharacterized transport system YnjBCD permease subunit
VVKFGILFLHVFFGMLSTVFASISLHYNSKNDSIKILNYSLMEFFASLITFISASIYYVYFYQADKHIVVNGKFPIAHTLFMEVKEHTFILYILLSLYLQMRLRFSYEQVQKNFNKEIKVVLVSLVMLGIFISILGIAVNIGFRINQ